MASKKSLFEGELAAGDILCSDVYVISFDSSICDAIAASNVSPSEKWHDLAGIFLVPNVEGMAYVMATTGSLVLTVSKG